MIRSMMMTKMIRRTVIIYLEEKTLVRCAKRERDLGEEDKGGKIRM